MKKKLEEDYKVVILIISILIIFITGYSVVKSLSDNNIKVKNGYLDLSEVNIDKEEPFTIDGEWEFYYGKHISPYDFSNENNSLEPSYEQLPASWTSYVDNNGEKLKSEGKATYRLKVKLSSENKDLGIKLSNIWGKSKIFIKQGSNIENINIKSEEDFTNKVVKSEFFNIESNEFDIIIQVENNNVLKSGILKSIYIGNQESILNFRDKYLIIDISSIVGLFIMFIYFISISYKETKSKYGISLAGYSLCSLLFISMTSEITIIKIFNKISMSQIYMFTMLVAIISSYSLLSYIDDYYNENKYIKVRKYYRLLVIIFSVLICFTPILNFLDMGKIQAISSIIIIIYVIYIIVRSIVNKASGEEFNILALISITLVILVIIYNTFMEKQINVLTPLYILIFIISQAVIISKKHFKSMDKIEELSNKFKVLDRVKDEFLERTSYELKMPLKGIANIANSLIDGVAGSLTEIQKENVELIATSTKRLSILVDDILDYSNFTNEYTISEMKAVNIKSILMFVLNIVSYAIKDKPILILNKHIDDYLIVIGDENRLKQVFYNLIDTLLISTNRGEITINYTVIGLNIFIEIKNANLYLEGKSSEFIEMECKEWINIGYPLEKGFSIGLLVAIEIIKIHGGNIKFDSTKENGTIFTVCLPIANDLNREIEVDNSKLESARNMSENSINNDREKKSILIFEPNVINQRVISNTLKIEGYSVNILDSEQQLNKILNKGIKADLCIVNSYLKNSSGYDLVKEIRNKYSNIDIPILMIVDKTYVENISLALHLGANDVLIEPYDINELKVRVNTLIQLKNSISSLVTSEMAFLKAQIKPHFIFNSLSVISSLIMRNPLKAKMLTLDFSDYLRSSFDFNSAEDVLPLSKEIELVKAYVAIEKGRFGDRLKVNIIIEENLESKLPPLVIQPIVENAIRHGVLKKIEGGEIIVNIYREYDEVMIIIKDDGVGMEEERVLKLLEGTDNRAGIGIGNINSRLIKSYGHGLTISSKADNGTEVIIKIPYNN